MDPFTIAIILKVIGGTTVVLVSWPWILDFFSTKIIPWVREHLSTSLADVLAEICCFIDNKAVGIRRNIKSLWKYLRENLLGCETAYTKISSNTAIGKTTTLVRNEDNKLMRTTVTEELNWDDLPEKIRSEMNRQSNATAELDQKKVIETKFKETAQERGMPLEMSN